MILYVNDYIVVTWASAKVVFFPGLVNWGAGRKSDADWLVDGNIFSDNFIIL